MIITNGHELVHPDYYADNGPPYAIWDRLRAESPLHWCELEDLEPFWAVTRLDDVKYISKTPEIFLSEPGITLMPKNPELREPGVLAAMKIVIITDPPVHRDLRKVASPLLTPRALERMQGVIDESAKSLVDELGGEGETDLAMGVAVRHPLRVLSKALGVPEEEEPRVLELSNRLFAPDDLELGGGRTSQEDFAKLGPSSRIDARIRPTIWRV